MFSKVYNWFIGAEHDIEAIIENFTSTVSKLEAAAVAKFKDAENAAASALHFQQVEADAKVAGQRAAEVAEKIKALVA